MTIPWPKPPSAARGGAHEDPWHDGPFGWNPHVLILMLVPVVAAIWILVLLLMWWIS